MDKESMILWPPKSSMVSNAVKMDKTPDSSWKIEHVQVKKLYADVLSARNAAKGYEASSTFESERELGRGCRKKKRKQNFSFDDECPKNKYCRIRSIVNSDTESEDDYLSSNNKEKTVPSPPPVHFFKSEKSSKFRKNEDTNLLERVKSKMTLHFEQKEHSNKKSPKKLKQDSFIVTPVQSSDENWKENVPGNFHEDYDLQLCESSKSSIFEKQDDSANSVIMTPQKNSKTSFSSSTPFSNDIPLKNLGNPTKFFNFQESQLNQHESSPTKSYSSQLSLSNSQQLNNSPKSLQSLQSKSNNSTKYRRELFTSLSSSSSLKSASDNSDTALLHLILKEVQEIKKKAALERQEINLKLDKVMTFYCRLSRLLLPKDKQRILPNDMPSYPLKTEEEMEISEEFLKNNENFCFLIRHLAQLHVKAKEETKVKDSDVLYAVMAAAITNTVACKYNFRGDGNKKKPFSKLLLWEVIIGAIHEKRPNITVADLSKYAGQWLKNAPYRKQEDGSYGKRDKK